MTFRSSSKIGQSKKEIMKIIEQIDAEKNQAEKPKANREDTASYFLSKNREQFKYSE